MKMMMKSSLVEVVCMIGVKKLHEIYINLIMGDYGSWENWSFGARE